MNADTAFRNQNIVILGLARQGLALTRFFVDAGAHVTVSDAAPAEKLRAELAEIADLPVELALGGHPATLLDNCDLLCLSGGVPPQIEFVQQAIRRGIPLSNDSLLTMQLARQRGLGPIVAITGSSGKTTTTTLVGEMLAADGSTVHVGGNIGSPLIHRLHEIQPGEPIVLELSSFQLELFDPEIARTDLARIGPDVAAILNVTPNHLDRHPDMAAYTDAKLNLLRYLPPDACVVLNADDAITVRLAAEHKNANADAPDLPAEWHVDEVLQSVREPLSKEKIRIIYFSRQRPLSQGAWYADKTLLYNAEAICPRAALKLRGDHNVSNVLAAAAISGAAGADVAAMRTVAQRFTGVPHRLEVVAESDGVVWINDSIATSPERALAGLRSFDAGAQTLILLAGGKDKNLPWEGLADEALRRVNFVIGFGAAGPMFVELVQARAQFAQTAAPNCAVVSGLPQAVDLAARVAQSSRHAGDASPSSAAREEAPHAVVLLSPGGTSYDAYRDFEARGEHFRQLAHAQSTAAQQLDLIASE